MVSSVVRLWFSRLVLSGRPRDVYDLHQLLWRAYEEDDERPFLFRADVIRTESGSRVKVLVQAVTEARWSALGDRLVSAEQGFHELTLHAGEQLRFFLRASPTVRRKGRSDPMFADLDTKAFRALRGRRVALVRDEDRLQWLERKAVASGVKVLGVRTSNARPWRWARRGNSARHDGVDFEGHLEIEDPELLATAVVTGIGTAKAFGFGLLSLAQEKRDRRP